MSAQKIIWYMAVAFDGAVEARRRIDDGDFANAAVLCVRLAHKAVQALSLYHGEEIDDARCAETLARLRRNKGIEIPDLVFENARLVDSFDIAQRHHPTDSEDSEQLSKESVRNLFDQARSILSYCEVELAPVLKEQNRG